MLNTSISKYRQLILPENFDADKSIKDVGIYLDCAEFAQQDSVSSITSASLRGVFLKKFRHEFPNLSRSQVERAYSEFRKKAASNDPQAKDFVSMTKALFVQSLQFYLKFLRDGEKTFWQSREMSEKVMKGDLHQDGFSLPDKAFEIVIDLPQINQMFMDALKALKPHNFEEGVSLKGANISVEVYKVIGFEDEPDFLRVVAHIFTPNGGSFTTRTLEINVEDFDLVLDLEEIVYSSLQLSYHHKDADDLEIGRPFWEVILASIQAMSHPDIVFTDEIDLRNALESSSGKKITTCSGRPAVINDLPSVAITRCSIGAIEDLSPVEIVEDLAARATITRWKTEHVPTGTVAELARPDKKNPHAHLHPQVIQNLLPNMTGSSYIRQLQVEKMQARIKDRMEREEAGSGVGFGSEGVQMDRVALEISPESQDTFPLIMLLYQEAVLDLPRDKRPEDLVLLQGLIHAYEDISLYQNCGSHCFLLNGDVARVMKQTDISQIQVSEITLPFNSIFMGFEEPVEVEIDGETLHFEGAYINGRRDTISVTAVFAPLDGFDGTLATLKAPLRISLPRQYGMSLEDAILEAIETNGYDTDHGDDIDFNEDESSLAGQIAEEFDTEVILATQSSQSKVAQRNEDAIGTLVDVLTLTANTMMAMTSLPEDIDVNETWFGLSEKAKLQMEAPSSKGKKRGRKMAFEEGVMPVRVISLTPEARERHQATIKGLRGSPSEAYWRKGHWRRQAYGKGKELRRWIWVEPVLCNTQAEAISRGTVYNL